MASIVLAIGRQSPTGVTLLGTSVAVNTRHLATTFHNVQADETGLIAVLPHTGLHQYQDTSDNSVQVFPLKISSTDPFRDICILELPPDILIQPNLQIGSADDAHPGAAVVTYGFPHADHGRLVLTQQTSTVGARVLIQNQGIKSKHIVLNVQARPGQSGGPVLLTDTNQLVALVIGSYAPGGGGGISLGGVDPHTLHQTTHAVSAEYVANMLP